MTKFSPVLMSTQMMTAYMNDRAWQTRRLLKLPKGFNREDVSIEDQTIHNFEYDLDLSIVDELSRYGAKGDRLWFRETWRPHCWDEDFDSVSIEYKAGGSLTYSRSQNIWRNGWEIKFINYSKECIKKHVNQSQSGHFFWAVGENPLSWNPSIFMPFAACRFKPAILSIEAEDLHSITEEDAIAEGVNSIAEYIELWDKLNAKRGYPWKSNPLVWKIEFQKRSELQKEGDQ